MGPLIGMAIGLGRAGIGAIQANQRYKRVQGQINGAYRIGQQRLDLEQGDQRQSFGESLLSRGLGQSGTVRAGGPVAPGMIASAIRPHDLGGQGVADLRTEQGLSQDALLKQRNDALSDAKASRTESYVNAAVSGISAGISAAGSAQTLGAMGGIGGAAGAAGAAGGGYQSMPSLTDRFKTPFTGSFGGIDPVDPLGRGAWANPATTGGFNVYGGANLGGR